MRHRLIRGRLLPVLVTLALGVAASVVSLATATPAQAASCTKKTGSAKTDPDGHSWTTWWICGNDSGAKMYRTPATTTLTGYMDTTSSWFVCWKRGAQHAGGNNVWYYSQGDRSASGQSARKAWGFMPAVNVWTSVDPWTGMAECPSTTVPTPTTTTTTRATTSTPSKPARTNGTNKPVLFLHGYSATGSVNCNSYWGNGTARSYFQRYGWSSSNLVFLTYYGSGGSNCTRFTSATTYTAIENIAIDFAWYVYNNYSSKGRAVDVVAHSMGGLVTRAAIAGTSNRRTVSGRSFPPYLYIEDAVQISSPNEGIRTNIQVMCTGLATATTQCLQMWPGSSFLSSWILRPSGSRVGYDNPQSQMGTDWSAIGSGDDWVVNTGSALNISATYHFGHKYIYLSGSGLDHGQVANIADNGGKLYKMRYCDYTASCSMSNWDKWTQTNSAHGPLWVAARAADTQGW